MRLLEYAEVVIGNGHWMKGWQTEDRMEGLSVETFDVCGVATKVVVAGGGVNRYEVRPFGIKAGFPRSLMCTQEDDEAKLREATKAATEPGVGVALCYEAAEGNDTWIGDNGVWTAADIATGRQVWLDHNVGRPALHLADDMVLAAVNDPANRVVLPVGDEFRTIWGDPVVNSPGYLPGAVFWTGPITVYLSTVDTDLLYNARNNDARVVANVVAAVDMPPGQVVRIGAVPT